MATDPATHWLPTPLNEGGRKTACGIDVFQHSHVQWLTAQNEANCRRCERANVPDKDGGTDD